MEDIRRTLLALMLLMFLALLVFVLFAPGIPVQAFRAPGQAPTSIEIPPVFLSGVDCQLAPGANCQTR